MAAPLAAAGTARAGALAWSERRWLLWLLVFILGVPLALVALIAAMVGGFAGQATAPPVDSYGPSQAALADIPALYLRAYVTAGISLSERRLHSDVQSEPFPQQKMEKLFKPRRRGTHTRYSMCSASSRYFISLVSQTRELSKVYLT